MQGPKLNPDPDDDEESNIGSPEGAVYQGLEHE